MRYKIIIEATGNLSKKRWREMKKEELEDELPMIPGQELPHIK